MTPKESNYYRNDFEFLNSEFLNKKELPRLRGGFFDAPPDYAKCTFFKCRSQEYCNMPDIKKPEVSISDNFRFPRYENETYTIPCASIASATFTKPPMLAPLM